MASRQWLQDNPKVLGYVTKPVYERLQAFSKERDISVSKALTLILEEYFEIAPELGFSIEDVIRRDAKLRTLEREVKDLKAALEELKHQPHQGQQEKTELSQSEPITQSDISPLKINTPKFTMKRQIDEPSDRTTFNKAAEQPSNRTSSQNSTLGFPLAASQDDSSATEEEDTPLSKTVRMRLSPGKSGRNGQTDASRNRSNPSDQRYQLKGKSAPDHSPEDPFKKFFERLNPSSSNKLGDSTQDRSSTQRPSLPPPLDP